MKKQWVLATISMALTIGLQTASLAQFVGPPAPKPEPAALTGGKLDQVKSSFMRLFKKETEPNLEDSVKSTEEPEKKTPASEMETTAKPTAPVRPPLLTAPSGPDARIADPVPSKENPPQKLVTLDNPTNPFGFTDAQAKLNQASLYIDKQEFAQARSILIPLRQWLVDTTEAHISLYKTLNNLPSARAQAELEKQLALQFALLRDKAMYQLSRIEIAERNYRPAIKDLIEVVKSQPRGDMGIKAYQLLQEIGFTEKLQLIE